MIIIPDSNFWISRTGEAEVIELHDRGLIRVACSDDIAEECITHEHSQARAALFKRIDLLCDLWLDKKSIVVDDLILRLRNPEYQPQDVILHSLNIDQYKKNIAAFLSAAKEDELLAARADRKAKQVRGEEEHRQKATDYWTDLQKLPEGHPERQKILNNSVVQLARACLDPSDQFGGLHLDVILKDYGQDTLTEEDTKQLCALLPQFPGFRFFYAHIMFNIFCTIKDKSSKKEVDPSFPADAQVMLLAAPERVVLTSDKKLLHTQREIFKGEPPLVVCANDLGNIQRRL